jgi:hypothetical protein
LQWKVTLAAGGVADVVLRQLRAHGVQARHPVYFHLLLSNV